MKEKESLDSILERHAKDNHVKHFDPLEAISHHVVFLIFLSLCFLFSLVLFLGAEPDPEFATTFAVFEWQSVNFGIWDSVTGFIHSAQTSPDRPYVLLALYTFWIIIFGLVNMFLYERSKK
jgi:hypothetical protein